MTPSVTRLQLAVLTHWNGRQYELAARCGIDNSDLTKYIVGRRPMLGHHRAILAAVLTVEPAEIDGWWDGKEIWEKLAG